MTPLRLSHTWHRRFYVAIFLLSLPLVAIYLLDYLAIFTAPDSIKVSTLSAVAAGIAAVTSLIFFFIEKKLSGFVYSMVVYTLLTIAVVYQVLQTGDIASPYLILWTILSLFAAIFGAYGWLVIIVLIGSYIAGAYLAGEFTFETIAIVSFSSIVPLIIGIILWREQGEIDDSTKNVKNLANQLSEVASKSEIVINAIGDGVMAIDPKGIIQLINPAAQEILGWGKQDALMLSYKSILKLEDENGQELQPGIDPIEEVLNTNQQARASKLLALTQSGKKISVALVVTPIGDAGAGAIVVFRDITKERSEEREQAEFISTASHEMRTPVASIEGYLGLALNPNTATIDARAKDFINKAHEAAQHLGRLFQDLLDVSKSEDGRMTNTPKVVDVVLLTQTIVQGLTQKAKDKGLQLVFNQSTTAQRRIMPVYFVNQDNDHIREILDNLVENAIKYTPAGEVVVDVSGADDRVVISVKDSGLGIPTEDIPHLFQKFYRVSNMDRQEIGGTGLGLYLSRRLAEAMQGRIWVESVFEHGSTFFLELPRIESQDAERLRQEQQAQAAQQAAAQPVVEVPIEASIAAPTPPVIPPAAATTGAPVADPAANAPVAAPAANPATPTAAPAVAPAPAAAAPVPAEPAVRPATTVPRGQTLTREQINERVKQLEALAKQQRGNIK
ncbi:MAG: ATP-binding protein [Candidatus Microsaccharimonas sp.]